MSGTDNTRPWSVKTLDKPSLLVEDHDHATGPCDLPPRPSRKAPPFGDHATRCTWVASGEFWHTAAHGGCCTMCSAQRERRIDRRRSRHQSRATSHRERAVALGADTLSDVDDLDGLDLDTTWSDVRAYDEYEIDQRFLVDLRAVANLLGLPATSHVVHVAHLGGPFDPTYDCCEDCAGCVGRDCSEYVVVEIMHPDGTRENLRYDVEWADLEDAIRRGVTPTQRRRTRRPSHSAAGAGAQ